MVIENAGEIWINSASPVEGELVRVFTIILLFDSEKKLLILIKD